MFLHISTMIHGEPRDDRAFSLSIGGDHLIVRGDRRPACRANSPGNKAFGNDRTRQATAGSRQIRATRPPAGPPSRLMFLHISARRPWTRLGGFDSTLKPWRRASRLSNHALRPRVVAQVAIMQSPVVCGGSQMPYFQSNLSDRRDACRHGRSGGLLRC